MKNLILVALILMATLLTACVPNAVDREIKDLIKDVPVPERFNTHTGELLTDYKIIVKDADKDGDDFSYYSGIDTRYFTVELKLKHGRSFYLDILPEPELVETHTYSIEVAENGTYQWFPVNDSGWEILHWGPPQLTLTDIRENIDRLEWEE